MPNGMTKGKKFRLIKAHRRAKSVPVWVILRTNRRVRRSKKWRTWRRSHLQK